MNRGSILFLGIFAAAAFSFWSLIIGPQSQIGQQQQRSVDPLTGQQHPAGRGGSAERGLQLYRALGCAECHTQQIRPEAQGYDIVRGWGKRRTVAQDYLRDQPVMLGNLRMGPDLADVGSRLPDRLWHLRHFYNPRLTAPGSIMPPYRFLFERRQLKANETPALRALPGDTEPGYQVVALPAAEALADYMLSLRVQASLTEAPMPPIPTNQVPNTMEGTNAPTDGGTNAASTPTNQAAVAPGPAVPATNSPPASAPVP